MGRSALCGEDRRWKARSFTRARQCRRCKRSPLTWRKRRVVVGSYSKQVEWPQSCSTGLPDVEKVRFWNRSQLSRPLRHPEFSARGEAVRGLNVEALIDGEEVVLRDDGRSDFHALLTKCGGAEASLVAFDVLRVEGVDLRLHPLEAQRETLVQLVDGVDRILFSEALAAEGARGIARKSRESCRVPL
jgi:hypothetical protein